MVKTIIALSLSIFMAAVLIAAILLAWVAEPDWIQETPFARSQSAAGGSDILTEFDVEEIARAWAANGVNGAAGGEIADFIVEESITAQPEMLRDFLKRRLESVTTWNYGQIVRTGESRYEMTATATTRVHNAIAMEVSPTIKFIGEPESANEPKDARVEMARSLTASDFTHTRIAKMPFSLTVDLESDSVTDWRARRDEADLSYRIESEKLPNLATVDDLYGDGIAKCVSAAVAEGLPDNVMQTLFTPPRARAESDAARARDAVDSAGLGGVCENWIGE